MIPLMVPALDVPIDIVADLVLLDQLGISDRGARAMDTARYVILSGLTITVTGLIALRILLLRRNHAKIMGKYFVVSKSIKVGNSWQSRNIRCL